MASSRIEYTDVAFYSILGADLARPGPRCSSPPPGSPRSAGRDGTDWYHWGELWLASLVVNLLGVTSLAARSFVVLPLLLLAAAALTGTLVRRIDRQTLAAGVRVRVPICLFLTPVPLARPARSSAIGPPGSFGITLFGLAAVAVLLAMYGLTVLTDRPRRMGARRLRRQRIRVDPAGAPHARPAGDRRGRRRRGRPVARSLRRRGRLPAVSPLWRRTLVGPRSRWLATLAWGTLTGHGLGGSGASAGVSPFNETWRDTLLVVLVGAGIPLAIPLAWLLARRRRPSRSGSTSARSPSSSPVRSPGACGWPTSTCSTCSSVDSWCSARRSRRSLRGRSGSGAGARRGARLLSSRSVLCLTQIEFAASLGILRLQRFGPGNDEPVPVSLLAAIRDAAGRREGGVRLPAGRGDLGSVNPTLLAIGAHTDRRIVPMCFEADALRQLVGGEPTFDDISPLFVAAPQRALFPTASARPSADAVVAFMQANGIDYIYADARASERARPRCHAGRDRRRVRAPAHPLGREARCGRRRRHSAAAMTSAMTASCCSSSPSHSGRRTSRSLMLSVCVMSPTVRPTVRPNGDEVQRHVVEDRLDAAGRRAAR